MWIRKDIVILFTLCAILVPTSLSSEVLIPGIVTVKATVKSAPPEWAFKERALITLMNEKAPEFLKKYAEHGGRMPLIGKPDDMYEVFGNWPLFYALGGDEKILDLALQQWDAITRELTYTVKRVDREFVIGYDWFHHSENYKNFYYCGLADPSIPANINRSLRFANMYTGEDTLAQNYDTTYKIMRSPLTGATGPVSHQECIYLLNHGHASLYPFIKEDLIPGWEKDPVERERIQILYDEIIMRGDTPISLSATALVANAYLYSGDEKYKRWIYDYTDAWIKRIAENNGIIPDNVGLTGKIGEYRNGQWWGGLFGWNARYSLHMIFGALTTASETAYLVTGDPLYLSLLRSQLMVLFHHSKTINGQLLFPYRYGPKGWFDYRPLEIRELGHLWNVSQSPEDWKFIEKVLAGSKYGPRPYDNYNDYAMPVNGHTTYHWNSNGVTMDFNEVISQGDIGDKMQEQEELNIAPWLLYLSGKNNDFPEKILDANYREVLRRVEESGNVIDIFKVPDLHSEYLAGINPVVIQGLVILTMGGPMAIYNGGLLQVRLRYFDSERERPGLPPDVAACVGKIEPDRTVVTLVNMNALESRRLIVQTGAYGEHVCTHVNWSEQSQDTAGNSTNAERSTSVNKSFFAVELPPGTIIDLDIGMKRFVNKPSYEFPWQRK